MFNKDKSIIVNITDENVKNVSCVIFQETNEYILMKTTMESNLKKIIDAVIKIGKLPMSNIENVENLKYVLEKCGYKTKISKDNNFLELIY